MGVEITKNRMVINGIEIDNEFIREYELYQESIRGSLYGQLYKVTIKLNDAGVKAGKMEEFLKMRGSYQHNDEIVTIIWEVPDYEGIHEVEIALFYDLNDGEYGTYYWECLRLSSDMLE